MKKIISVILSISVLIGACCISVSAAGNADGAPQKLYLTDDCNWGKVYMYAEDSEGNPLCGEWPGSLITETVLNQYGMDIFVCDIPENTYSVIFSDVSASYETEPIYDFENYNGYWMNGTKNEYGKLKVLGYSFINEAEPTTTSPGVNPNKPVVRFLDSLNWGTAFLYAWDKDGNELLGAFPGTKIEGTFSSFGDKEFVCQIPQNAAGIKLSNEKGEKTEDITELSKYDVYVIDGYCDEKGNHKVVGSNSNLPQPVVENKPGDVNGDNVLDVLDSVEIQKNSVDKIQFTDAQKRIGDYNKDGSCDVLDAVEIQKAIVAD